MFIWIDLQERKNSIYFESLWCLCIPVSIESNKNALLSSSSSSSLSIPLSSPSTTMILGTQNCGNFLGHIKKKLPADRSGDTSDSDAGPNDYNVLSNSGSAQTLFTIDSILAPRPANFKSEAPSPCNSPMPQSPLQPTRVPAMLHPGLHLGHLAAAAATTFGPSDILSKCTNIISLVQGEVCKNWDVRRNDLNFYVRGHIEMSMNMVRRDVCSINIYNNFHFDFSFICFEWSLSFDGLIVLAIYVDCISIITHAANRKYSFTSQFMSVQA